MSRTFSPGATYALSVHSGLVAGIKLKTFWNALTKFTLIQRWKGFGKVFGPFVVRSMMLAITSNIYTSDWHKILTKLGHYREMFSYLQTKDSTLVNQD
jgi:hypothetical protein